MAANLGQSEEIKNPPANRRVLSRKKYGQRLNERLGNLGVQFDRVRMIAFYAV